MLELIIEPQEYSIEKSDGVYFFSVKRTVLQLEHSLLSLSKWESMYKKPFLVENEKSIRETIDYVKCMTINKNINPVVYELLNDRHIQKVNDYISDPHTATTFSSMDNKRRGGSSEIVTSELIYYWMVALQIPVKFETWHLNRLLTLIRICEIKNRPKDKKGSKGLSAADRHKLNMSRRASRHSKG